MASNTDVVTVVGTVADTYLVYPDQTTLALAEWTTDGLRWAPTPFIVTLDELKACIDTCMVVPETVEVEPVHDWLGHAADASYVATQWNLGAHTIWRMVKAGSPTLYLYADEDNGIRFYRPLTEAEFNDRLTVFGAPWFGSSSDIKNNMASARKVFGGLTSDAQYYAQEFITNAGRVSLAARMATGTAPSNCRPFGMGLQRGNGKVNVLPVLGATALYAISMTAKQFYDALIVSQNAALYLQGEVETLQTAAVVDGEALAAATAALATAQADLVSFQATYDALQAELDAAVEAGAVSAIVIADLTTQLAAAVAAAPSYPDLRAPLALSTLVTVAQLGLSSRRRSVPARSHLSTKLLSQLR